MAGCLAASQRKNSSPNRATLAAKERSEKFRFTSWALPAYSPRQAWMTNPRDQCRSPGRAWTRSVRDKTVG